MAEQVPEKLVAGDTWAWTRELSDYPASTHTAVWHFENADNVFNISATASGDAFVGSYSAASSAAVKPGRYRWRLVVTKTSDSTRTSAEPGWLEVLPDPAASGRIDWRSQNRRTLDAINAVIEKRASVDQESVSISGRSLSRTPVADLLLLRDRYARLVRDEEALEAIAAGVPTGRRILTRMV